MGLLKTSIFLLIGTGGLNGVLALKADGNISIMLALIGVFTVILGCFLAHYLKFITNYKEDLVNERTCKAISTGLHEKLDVILCFVKKLNGEEKT